MFAVVVRHRLTSAVRNIPGAARRRMSMGAPLATREQERQLFKRESPATNTGMEIDEFVMPPEPTFRPTRIGLSWLFGFYFLVAIVLRLSDPSASPDVLKVENDELLPKGRSMLFRERGIMAQQQQVEKPQ